jgi:hypothetical protein
MNFWEKAKQRRQEEDKQMLIDRLDEIENIVFTHSKEKIDDYSKSILLAHLVENQKNVHDLKVHMSSNIVKHNYDGSLSPFSAFMLRWGWGIWVVLFFVAIVWCYPIYSTNERELDKLRKVIKYDADKKQYFISKDNYTVLDKDDDRKGIILNTQE